jgi:biotin transport system substrate-specific component
MRDVHNLTAPYLPVRTGSGTRRGVRILTLLSLSLAFAAFTGALAQVRFYLPFTPVPVTGQVLYVALGVAGVPWFVLGPVGPTGGYIVGFVLAPAIVGSLIRRRGGSFVRPFLAMLAGVVAIYALGLVQFSLFTHKGIIDAARVAVLPFIPFDVMKALFASLAARLFTGRARAAAG